MPKAGHLQLFERAPVASMVRASLVSQILLAFCVNQLDQASVLSALLSFHPRCPPKGIPGSIRGWTLVGMYQRNRNRLTDIENRLVVAKGEGWSGSLGLADVSFYIRMDK